MLQEYLISTKIIESFDKILGEIEINNFIYLNQDEQKNDFASNKKEKTKTDIGTVFGNEKSKTVEFTRLINNEETDNFNKKNEQENKKNNSIQNKLFSKLTDYQKSLFIFKISLVFLSIIEGRKTKDEVIKKILRDFDYKLIFTKSLDIYVSIEKECEFFLYIDENCSEYSESGLQSKIVSEV